MDELASFAQAEGAVAEIVAWYNHHRLHSGIGYVTPVAMHLGDANQIHEERRAKLAETRYRRKEEKLNLRKRSLALVTHPDRETARPTPPPARTRTGIRRSWRSSLTGVSSWATVSGTPGS